MDDLQFWLYVIIGVIYLISQVRKKSKQQREIPPDEPSPRRQTSEVPQWQSETPQPTSGPKPITFEDLLREITEAKTPKSTAEYKPYEQPEYVDYDDDIEEEIKEVEPVDYRKTDPIYKQYDEAKTRDYSKFTNYSLEDTLKLENVNMQFGKFKEFESEASVNLLDQYTKDLRDPQGFKRAIVLSEVLSPRHF